MNLSDYNWQELLARLNEEVDEGNFYIFTLNKGTSQERRTRFLTLKEAKEFATKIGNGSHSQLPS